MSSQTWIGLGLAALVSAGAVEKNALTVPGGVVAAALGALIFSAGGVAWSIPFLIYFVTSSLFSRSEGAGNVSTLRALTSARNARQVLANGFLPACWALGQIYRPGDIWVVLFGAAVATAAADTWATEIGRSSSAYPHDILTGRRVLPGTSGGITARGTVASLAGSAAVVGTGVLTGALDFGLAPTIVCAGVGGALVDSLLGATLQERRWCAICVSETEDTVHALCLAPTVYRRGIPGFDNDLVNFSSCAVGSGLGALVALLG